MQDDATLSERWAAPREPGRAAPPRPCLVVLAAAGEPERVGEALFAPEAGTGIFGRGDVHAADTTKRLLLRRVRPSAAIETFVLRNPRVSRTQLLIGQQGPNQLTVRNVGRCRASANGELVEEATLAEGDVLTLGNQVAFLCTLRSPAMAPLATPPRHAFGEPDEWGFVGESEAMWSLRRSVLELGPRSEHVLILGPSGSGKEPLANALHACGARPRGPWVSRNAATIPESLLDAELFGHARNFPNAGMPERAGLVGEANGGDLFLDEIGELPFAAQAHLLRVLDKGEYQRLGDPVTRRSNFRLIAATNRPRAALKHDVLARFAFVVELSGLERRRDDIPLLARHLLRAEPKPTNPDAASIVEEGDAFVALMARLARHGFSTHIRELRAILGSALRPDQPAVASPELSSAGPPSVAGDPPPSSDARSLDADRVQASLDANNGSLEKTWRSLGLPNRFVLNRLIQKHALEIRKSRRPSG